MNDETRFPRDKFRRADLYREAELTAEERAAVEQYVVSDPRDLLTPEQHAELDRDLAEIARLRRRAVAESAYLEMP